MKILLADDSEVAISLVEMVFEPFLTPDDIIIRANDGAEALKLYIEHSPDIAIIDLTMPKLTGKQLIKKIRAFDKKGKIVVLTADVQKFNIVDLEEFNIFAYLNKPLKENNVKIILDRG